MACGGCEKRREALKQLWRTVRGATLRGDSVMLSGDRHTNARLEAEAQAERMKRIGKAPSWAQKWSKV